jgi:hypothetical protein
MGLRNTAEDMERYGTEWEGETLLHLDYSDDLSVPGKNLVK